LLERDGKTDAFRAFAGAFLTTPAAAFSFFTIDEDRRGDIVDFHNDLASPSSEGGQVPFVDDGFHQSIEMFPNEVIEDPLRLSGVDPIFVHGRVGEARVHNDYGFRLSTR
jgi:hypothetical protein